MFIEILYVYLSNGLINVLFLYSDYLVIERNEMSIEYIDYVWFRKDVKGRRSLL